MERYVSERADIFPVGADGNLRSNRALAQAAGQYACDLFVGATLQIDAQGNSSTATKDRIAGFGASAAGAKNVSGSDVAAADGADVLLEKKANEQISDGD